MKKELEGKKWGELDEATKDILMNEASAVDGSTGNSLKWEGDCIVDFIDTCLSIKGRVLRDTDGEETIIIDDDSVIYNSNAFDD